MTRIKVATTCQLNIINPLDSIALRSLASQISSPSVGNLEEAVDPRPSDETTFGLNILLICFSIALRSLASQSQGKEEADEPAAWADTALPRRRSTSPQLHLVGSSASGSGAKRE